MPYEDYKQFAFEAKREQQEIIETTLPSILPGFKEITKNKKHTIISNFEEV